MRAAHHLLGLAPSGVYLANYIAAIAGGLLHHRFTLTNISLSKNSGGLLSVALSCGSLRVGVTHHFALGSPDFPRYFHNAAIRVTHCKVYLGFVG